MRISFVLTCLCVYKHSISYGEFCNTDSSEIMNKKDIMPDPASLFILLQSKTMFLSSPKKKLKQDNVDYLFSPIKCRSRTRPHKPRLSILFLSSLRSIKQLIKNFIEEVNISHGQTLDKEKWERSTFNLVQQLLTTSVD